MAQTDTHYFDVLHGILLGRIQQGNVESVLAIVALPHVHENPLFWLTCTYPAGLAAAVLSASFGPSPATPTAPAMTTSASHTDEPHASAVTGSYMPATQPLSLVLESIASDGTTDSHPMHWRRSHEEEDTLELIAGTPAPTASSSGRSPAAATGAAGAATTAGSPHFTSTATTTTTTSGASPAGSLASPSSSAAPALGLPELYQLLHYCLRAAPATAGSPPNPEHEGSGIALLRSLVHLLEQPTGATPQTRSTADGGTGCTELTDGRTVDLVSVCATLLEQVRGLVYVNPLGTTSQPQPQQPPVPTTTTAHNTNAAAAAAAATPRKRARSPEPVLPSPSSSSDPATGPTTSKSAAGTAAITAAAAAEDVSADRVTTSSSATASDAQRQLMDAATSPYTSTDALEVLKGIAPLPGSTRVLPSFVEVGDFLAHDDDAHAEEEDAQKDEVRQRAAVKREGSHEAESTAKQTDADDQTVPVSIDDETDDETDDDDDEDRTVLEVLMTSGRPSVATGSAPARVPVPTTANVTAGVGAAAPPSLSLSATATARVQHSAGHPTRTTATTATTTTTARTDVTGHEEAARVAFAIRAFDEYEDEVAVEAARLRREAIVNPTSTSSTLGTVVRNAESAAAAAAPLASSSSSTDGVQRRVHFTEEEDTTIINGVARFGQTSRAFLRIFQEYRSIWQEGRTATRLSDHWRDALKKKALLMRVPPSPQEH